MTTKRIIYVQPTGEFSGKIFYLIPCPNARMVKSEDGLVPAYDFWRDTAAIPSNIEWAETERQFIDRIIAKDVPQGATDVHVVECDTLPDLDFIAAWEVSGERVVVNLEIARDVHLERIRAARDEALRELDSETIKALGSGDSRKVAQIESEKQVLRDIPQRFDLRAAKDAAELKVLWPPSLKR